MRADPNATPATMQRAKLLRGSSLSWAHWGAVALSIVVTLSAWYFAKQQFDRRIQARFDRESAHVVELISERMRKYEDALWGGAGMIRATSGRIDHAQWRAFAATLQLDRKYPGINGIGVIDRLTPAELPSYLDEQRRSRPDFRVHPEHDQEELWPIVYVEPLELNRGAVGLDIAHESSRRVAAMKARDTGTAQITGPIVLAQDAGRTPGFLFFVPVYRQGASATPQARRDGFVGLVYAPFIVQRLMQGVLRREIRQVGVRIRDGEEILFDELSAAQPGFDPAPVFHLTSTVPMYGRTWTFEVWSDDSFRAAAASNQPLTILVGGVLIDGLLLGLFLLLSRSNARAVQYADLAHEELRAQALRLAASNRELEDFASIAAHDLQEPLRKIQAFGSRIEAKFGPQLPPAAADYFARMRGAAERMSTLINDLLTLARVQSRARPFQTTDLGVVVQGVLSDLEARLASTGATLQVEALPTIEADATQMQQLFLNLIGNALKFAREGVAPVVVVTASTVEVEREGSSQTYCEIVVRDNGIGFSPEHREKIFTVFQRLHARSAYEGTGLGLALCRRIVERHAGTITAQGVPGQGATFVIQIPTQHTGSTAR